MSEQQSLAIEEEVGKVGEYKFEPIKGYPMLNWKGKRPFTGTQYYPAQLKEVHGEAVNGWLNKIFWGDNLQVMSHLLKEYRGKVQLVYIDPPYDSKADYKKSIQLKGKSLTNDQSNFEEKQYTDIWSNDEYLQFMYERLVLIRELLTDTGTIFIHCDWHKSHYLRCILEELFGPDNFLNEIIWKRKSATSYASKKLGIANDTLLWASKRSDFTFNPEYSIDDEKTQKYIKERFRFKTENGRIYKVDNLGNPEYRPNLIYEYKGCKPPPNGWAVSLGRMERMDEEGKLEFPKNKDGRLMRRQFLDEYQGQLVQNIWLDIPIVNSQAKERNGYPTQKPEALLDRVIKLASNKDDIIFDCFMGSGTTQAAAMKLGRCFIGADINLGAVQTTTKRLLNVAKELKENAQQSDLAVAEDAITTYYGIEVYNVNHYDVFRNPIQAIELLVQALELNPLPRQSSIYDGEKDGWMVKIMPVNRIATRADLNELISGFDWKAFEQSKSSNPSKPVEKIQLVCMGHESELADVLKQEAMPYKIDVEVLDILRNKQQLQFKRDSEVKITIENNQLIIEQFYPMNLLEKLSLEKQNVEDWRELVDSIMIDFNYDGAVLEPTVIDIPERNELVKGRYPIPEDAGTIHIKITDLLSESLETEVYNG